jgi:hypothetical protein
MTSPTAAVQAPAFECEDDGDDVGDHKSDDSESELDERERPKQPLINHAQSQLSKLAEGLSGSDGDHSDPITQPGKRKGRTKEPVSVTANSSFSPSLTSP